MSMTDQNQILIELTGPLQRAAGCSEVVIPCESSRTLGAVCAWLLIEFPATKTVLGDSSRYAVTEGDLPPGLLVICDSVTLKARLETAVKAGDRLTLMPMISGG
jgi:molybdopterin converting factor small subunit